MADLLAMAGIGQTIELRGIEYRLSAVTLGDLAALLEEAARRSRAALRDRLADFAEALKAAEIAPLDRLKSLEQAEREWRAQTNGEIPREPWAISWLVWRGLRRANPEMSLEEAAQLVEVEEMARVMEALGLARSAPEEERKNAEAAGA
jgi:hypothetical protein